MITIKHIKLYKKYGGDGDGFLRCASTDEKALFDKEQWWLIDNLLHDIMLAKKGLVSVAYNQSTDKKLKEVCDNQDTIRALTAYH